YFQLANVMGVDKELGFSLSANKRYTDVCDSHFIGKDLETYQFGEGVRNVYALHEDTEIIAYSDGDVHVASAPFGKGRGVYLEGLPYTHENTRLLMRGMYYAARREAAFYKWHASNVH